MMNLVIVLQILLGFSFLSCGKANLEPILTSETLYHISQLGEEEAARRLGPVTENAEKTARNVINLYQKGSEDQKKAFEYVYDSLMKQLVPLCHFSTFLPRNLCDSGLTLKVTTRRVFVQKA